MILYKSNQQKNMKPLRHIRGLNSQREDLHLLSEMEKKAANPDFKEAGTQKCLTFMLKIRVYH